MSFNIKRNIVPRSVWRKPVHFIAFGFGSGTVPYAPGTVGTLVAIPIYLLLAPLSVMTYALVTVVMFVIGVWICDRTSKDIGVHDHSGIVWDEIVGYLVTMFMAPPGWLWWLAGFVLFRFFDILKPFPIAALDRRIAGGLGIMVDDVLAGIYAALLLQIAVYTVT